MRRFLFFCLAISILIQFPFGLAISPPALAQEWQVRGQRGTLRVVDLREAHSSLWLNYAEGLVTLDRDNKWVPCLARDWRWIDDRTIDFRLRPGVIFHNGEKFDAKAVQANWEAYRKMEVARPHRWLTLPDETEFKIIDDYTVRFAFPEPDGLAFVKFVWFFQIAPAFFAEHNFDEKNYGYLPKAGPWGTGPFKFVEGTLRYAKPSERVVLKAFADYWDPQYPR